VAGEPVPECCTVFPVPAEPSPAPRHVRHPALPREHTALFDPDNGCVIARIDASGLWRWTWSEPATLPSGSVHERIGTRLAALGFVPAIRRSSAVAPYRMHQRWTERKRVGRFSSSVTPPT